MGGVSVTLEVAVRRAERASVRRKVVVGLRGCRQVGISRSGVRAEPSAARVGGWVV